MCETNIFNLTLLSFFCHNNLHVCISYNNDNNNHNYYSSNNHNNNHNNNQNNQNQSKIK